MSDHKTMIYNANYDVSYGDLGVEKVAELYCMQFNKNGIIAEIECIL